LYALSATLENQQKATLTTVSWQPECRLNKHYLSFNNISSAVCIFRETTFIQMDFTYCEFPSTVSIDTFKAYFNLADVKLPKVGGKSLDTIQIPNEVQESQANQAKSLRHLVLDAIVENWSGENVA